MIEKYTNIENVPAQTVFRASKPWYIPGGWVESEITVAKTHEKTTKALLTILETFGLGDTELWTYSLRIVGERETEDFSRRIGTLLSLLNDGDVQKEIVDKKTISETVRGILELADVREMACSESIYE